MTGHSSTNQRPRRGEDLRLDNRHPETRHVQISLEKDRSPSCEILRIGEKVGPTIRARALVETLAVSTPTSLCSLQHPRKLLREHVRHVRFLHRGARPPRAQAIRRSRKATGKGSSVRRGVVAKAVEAAPKLVTTKVRGGEFYDISRPIPSMDTWDLAPILSAARDRGRGGARRGNPDPPDDSSRQNAPRHSGKPTTPSSRGSGASGTDAASFRAAERSNRQTHPQVPRLALEPRLPTSALAPRDRSPANLRI